MELLLLFLLLVFRSRNSSLPLLRASPCQCTSSGVGVVARTTARRRRRTRREFSTAFFGFCHFRSGFALSLRTRRFPASQGGFPQLICSVYHELQVSVRLRVFSTRFSNTHVFRHLPVNSLLPVNKPQPAQTIKPVTHLLRASAGELVNHEGVGAFEGFLNHIGVLHNLARVEVKKPFPKAQDSLRSLPFFLKLLESFLRPKKQFPVRVV